MKKYLILAVIFIVLGSLILTMTACSGDRDLKTMFNITYEKKEIEIKDSFNKVSIYSDTADITVRKSEDGNCKIVSSDKKSVYYSSSVENGVLNIRLEDARKWHEKIFNFGSQTLDVYLSKTEFDSLIIDESTGNTTITDAFRFDTVDIKISTGDIQLENLTADSLSVRTSTGDVTMKDITCAGDVSLKVSTGATYLCDVSCKNLTSNGDTGDITIENLAAYENASIKRTAGKVDISDSTVSGNLDVKVSTGKSNLSGILCANLTSDGSTGYINLTNVIAEEKFDINRSTGNVKFIACDAVEIYVKTNTGDVKGTLLTDKVYIISTSTGKTDVPKTITGGRCEITTTTGDVKIEIKN